MSDSKILLCILTFAVIVGLFVGCAVKPKTSTSGSGDANSTQAVVALESKVNHLESLINAQVDVKAELEAQVAKITSTVTEQVKGDLDKTMPVAVAAQVALLATNNTKTDTDNSKNTGTQARDHSTSTGGNNSPAITVTGSSFPVVITNLLWLVALVVMAIFWFKARDKAKNTRGTLMSLMRVVEETNAQEVKQKFAMRTGHHFKKQPIVDDVLDEIRRKP